MLLDGDPSLSEKYADTMSRRPMQRTASSEAIFAKRRGEIPYQIYFEIRYAIGASCKKSLRCMSNGISVLLGACEAHV